MTPVEWTLVALVALVGACAAFVLFEFAARAWLAAYGSSYVWAPGSRIRLEMDREALPTLEAVVEHEINTDGERGDAPPRDATRTFRALVVGGSAAECYFLDQESAWPHVLQDVLQTPENLRKLHVEHAHVGNIARSLVTCRHIDRILAGVLPHYERLDAILFMVGASDVVNWMERGTPDSIAEDPIPASVVFAQHPEGPFGWGPRTLALRRIASKIRRRTLRHVEVRRRAGKRLAEARLMRQNAREILRETPDPAVMLAHFDKWFTRVLERARSKARVVLVVRQPWLEKQFTPEETKLLWSYGVGRPYEKLVTKYFTHEAAWKLLRAVDERASQVATRMNIAQVDLMPHLPADFVTWYDEQHNTPLGCRIVGRVVAEALVEAAGARRRAAESDSGGSDEHSALASEREKHATRS